MRTLGRLLTWVVIIEVRMRKYIGDENARRLLAMTLRSIYWMGGTRCTSVILAADSRIPSSLTDGVVKCVRRRGVVFELRLGDNAQKTLYFTGWYEREFMEWLISNLRPGDVYLDVGAHVGTVALVAARAISDQRETGRVIAVEPTQDSAQALRAGAERNGLRNVSVEETMLGADAGTAKLYADGRFSGEDAGVRSRFNTGAEVGVFPVATADQLLSKIGVERLDLVKIDVEGSELDVVRGMRGSLTSLRPRAVVVEVGEFRLSQAGVTVEQIDEALESCSYVRSGQVFLENVVYVRRR